MSSLPYLNPDRVIALETLLQSRCAILDGAMGTMIQSYQLTEADFRGDRFADESRDQRGNNDLLSLTRPDIIRDIHLEYLRAGADMVETNTFNSTSLSLADYGLSHLASEFNVEGARLARDACDTVADEDGRQRFVIGILGPTAKTASMSPDVNLPGFRATTFEELRIAYLESSLGLIAGGADAIMIETVFDTLNAKAAIFAVEQAFESVGGRLPIMISGTITDASGRTLSGQTTDAFWYSVRHANPMSIGLNCALGARELRTYMDILAQVAPDAYLSCHPNAGLPNAFGGYDEGPGEMAGVLAEFAEAGLFNIVGGCCGTTPAHIAAIAEAVRGVPVRQLKATN